MMFRSSQRELDTSIESSLSKLREDPRHRTSDSDVFGGGMRAGEQRVPPPNKTDRAKLSEREGVGEARTNSLLEPSSNHSFMI
jgi:hypothetical protein